MKIDEALDEIRQLKIRILELESGCPHCIYYTRWAQLHPAHELKQSLARLEAKIATMGQEKGKDETAGD